MPYERTSGDPMPLDRAHTTIATQLMLPANVVFSAVIGINYLHTDTARLRATPALRFADNHFPLPVCGAMFLICAGLILLALIGKRSKRARPVASYALLVTALCQLIWAGFFLAAALQTNDASPTACAWPAYIAVSCFASYLSLRAGEV